jgi:hypothetical protein
MHPIEPVGRLAPCYGLPNTPTLALDIAAVLLYKSSLIGGAIHDVFALASYERETALKA